MKEAEQFFNRAIELIEKKFGKDHPYLSDYISYLGLLYKD